MAVVRRAAIDAGGFAVELGRQGTSLGSEEEVELLTRMLREGGAIGWLPEARVRHLVPAACSPALAAAPGVGAGPQ